MPMQYSGLRNASDATVLLLNPRGWNVFLKGKMRGEDDDPRGAGSREEAIKELTFALNPQKAGY